MLPRAKAGARGGALLREHRDDYGLRLLASGARIGDGGAIIATLNQNADNRGAERFCGKPVRTMPKKKRELQMRRAGRP